VTFVEFCKDDRCAVAEQLTRMPILPKEHPGTMKAQQALTKSSTNPDQAKANVEGSSKVARQKPKNVKDMTPEERTAWRKHADQSRPESANSSGASAQP
jgi:hypothetical protein